MTSYPYPLPTLPYLCTTLNTQHIKFDYIASGTVPNKKTGSCLDPELPGTSLWREAHTGPGTPYLEEKSQLEPTRDGGDMRKGKEEPIRDVVQEDQRTTE
jgi:hypothetical protein